VEYYGRLQQQGEIDSFEPFGLEPHGGDLNGFLLVRGDRDKLARLCVSEAFMRPNLRGVGGRAVRRRRRVRRGRAQPAVRGFPAAGDRSGPVATAPPPGRTSATGAEAPSGERITQSVGSTFAAKSSRGGSVEPA
jgi:hypothetical protein